MASILAGHRTKDLRNHIYSQQQQQQQVPETKAARASPLALRPIITSINGNVAWIVSLPRPPASDVSPAHQNGRAYFHVLVDPWFGEEAVAGHRIILGMTLVNPPALKDPAAVVKAIHEIEAATAAQSTSFDKDSDDYSNDKADGSEGAYGEGLIDGIVATGSIEHAMRSSFTRFSSKIPVFATAISYKSICGWKYFDTVESLDPYDPTAPSTAQGEEGRRNTWSAAHKSSASMPSWLTILALKVENFNNFAVVLVLQDTLGGEGAEAEAEAIIMAPHGIFPSEKTLRALITPSSSEEVSSASSTEQRPKVPRVLAYLGPYKDSYTSVLHVVCGVSEWLCFSQLPKDGVKYYVHNGDLPDGDLQYTGLLSYLLRDEPRTMAWGIEKLRQGKGGDGVVYGEKDANNSEERGTKGIKVPSEVAVGNGESYVLL